MHVLPQVASRTNFPVHSLSLVLAMRGAVLACTAAEVIRRFDEGDALKVTVLSIMGKDMVIAVETDHDE